MLAVCYKLWFIRHSNWPDLSVASEDKVSEKKKKVITKKSTKKKSTATKKEITTIIEEKKPKGQHQFYYNTEHLSNGTYFCQFHTDKNKKMQKIVVMK